MNVAAKICGIQDESALGAAVEGGARYVGFVFIPQSRRHVTREQAWALTEKVPRSVWAVGLFVDPTDEELRAVVDHVPLNMIQLHGRETPERVADVRRRFVLPVMKAIPVAAKEDVDAADSYAPVADYLLFDTKLGPASGGTGVAFDWNLLRGRSFAKPWMLAGGINSGNLAEAVAVTGARIVDVSSGVEDASGHKDPARIGELLALTKRI